MMLARAMLIFALGTAALFPQGSAASVVATMFDKYIEIEAEIGRSTAKDERATDRIVAALRELGHTWYSYRSPDPARETSERVFQDLMHYPWIVAGDDADRPSTIQQVGTTADDWMCACVVNTALMSAMSANAERWLRADADGADDRENHQALTADIKDAIARFHDETQVELALAAGSTTDTIRAKYVAYVEKCMSDYS